MSNKKTATITNFVTVNTLAPLANTMLANALAQAMGGTSPVQVQDEARIAKQVSEAERRENLAKLKTLRDQRDKLLGSLLRGEDTTDQTSEQIQSLGRAINNVFRKLPARKPSPQPQHRSSKGVR